MMEIAIIAAVSRNGVIGKDGRIPWRLPEDMRRFKALTTTHGSGELGDCVVMGRNTYDSIGKPLPKRDNIVVSTTLCGRSPYALHEREPSLPCGSFGSNADHARLWVEPSLRAAIRKAGHRGAKTLWICGGSRLYEEALPLATRMELTVVNGEYEGDAFFPYWHWSMIDQARAPYPWRIAQYQSNFDRTQDGRAYAHTVRLDRISGLEQQAAQARVASML
jgi:dihydrofolate reductase